MKIADNYSMKSTLKEVSRDSKNREYMIESDLEIIDFDKEKEVYVTKMKISVSPKSCDALYRDSDKNYFIEFKNGKVETYDVRKKVYDSILIHCDITKEDISQTRKNSIFILVYDYEKIKKTKIMEIFLLM